MFSPPACFSDTRSLGRIETKTASISKYFFWVENRPRIGPAGRCDTRPDPTTTTDPRKGLAAMATSHYNTLLPESLAGETREEVPMRRVLFALTIGTALIFSAAGVFAQDPGRAVTSMSTGTYGPGNVPPFGGGSCGVGGCVGELLICAADEAISPINVTYYFLRNICDNREIDGLLPCDDRYRGYGEECSKPLDDEYTSGTVTSRQTDGAFRVCFSDPAEDEADCASSTPAAEVIANGTTQSHTNHVSGTEILMGVGRTTLSDEGLSWVADSQTFRWDRVVGISTVVHTQAQINGGTCPVTSPCGLSSTSVLASGSAEPSAGEIIVDNLDSNTSMTGSWLTSSGLDPFKTNSVYNNSNSTFRWLPNGLKAADYEVFVYWTFHVNRSANVPYRIQASGTPVTIVKDQTIAGDAGKFISLGVHTFDGLGNEWVEVSSENGQASADAVRLVLQ